MDFIRLFIQYKIPFDSTSLKRGWVNVQCPWCDDKSQNGGFNISGSYFFCWRCGAHGLKQTLSRILSIPLNAIDDIVKEYEGRHAIVGALNKKEVSAKKTLALPSDGFTDTEKKYLIKRKYNPQYLSKHYGVVGGGIIGEWKYRIIIPVFLRNKVVSWTARSILSNELLKQTKQPRYKQLRVEESIVDPKKIIYNSDNCTGQKIILLEGVFDVMRMGDGFACVLGTEMTHSQVRFIKNKYSKVYILFDAEKEAQNKAYRYGLQLSALGLEVEIVDAFGDYGKKDAGELTQKEAKDLRSRLDK